MNHLKKHAGFTMIELLFVIVILGIVGTISMETIRQYYESIFKNQEYSQRVAEADHILEQLSKYFENAISVSIVNLDINPNTVACYGPPQDGNTTDATVAFIGVDTDSLQGLYGFPGWNEEMVLEAGNVVTSLDSNFTATDNIMGSFGASLDSAALYDSDSANIGSCQRFGMTGTAGSAGFHRISNVLSSTSLELNHENNASHGKNKYMLRSGYAFRVADNGDLNMYTNFQPWNGDYYTNGDLLTLGKNVAHFYADYDVTDFADQDITDRGLVWRLKICMRGVKEQFDGADPNSDDQGLGICRERRVHVRY